VDALDPGTSKWSSRAYRCGGSITSTWTHLPDQTTPDPFQGPGHPVTLARRGNEDVEWKRGFKWTLKSAVDSPAEYLRTFLLRSSLGPGTITDLFSQQPVDPVEHQVFCWAVETAIAVQSLATHRVVYGVPKEVIQWMRAILSSVVGRPRS